MNFPEELYYTKDHEWLKVEGDVVIVGITDYAQSELGDIVFIDIETQGDTLESETVFGSVEAVKTVSDLFMPVSGEITEVNDKLNDQPELVNSDPYGAGWMVKIKMSDPSQLKGLMKFADYREQVAS